MASEIKLKPCRSIGAAARRRTDAMREHEFHSPTAGRAGNAETAEAKDAAVRPEVKR